jgi:hypothetical protein
MKVPPESAAIDRWSSSATSRAFINGQRPDLDHRRLVANMDQRFSGCARASRDARMMRRIDHNLVPSRG